MPPSTLGGENSHFRESLFPPNYHLVIDASAVQIVSVPCSLWSGRDVRQLDSGKEEPHAKHFCVDHILLFRGHWL